MIKLGSEVVGQSHFGDNALHLIMPNPDGWTITWLYENDAELFTVICLRRHFEGIGMKLYMPYCPHARMDRVKNPEDVFTLKYFCEVINSLNFNEVIIEDPHSDVCVALLNNVIVRTPEENVNKVINMINDDSLVMFYPDKGAMHRYEGMLDLPFAYGEKKRNWETGRIESLEIVNQECIEGNAVLIVDDICSYGGTFARAAKALRDAGASAIYVYVTHCEDNIFKGAIFEENNIDHVFTTKSIYRNAQKHPAGERITVL